MRSDQPKALALAGEAFDLWQGDRLEEGEARYLEALSHADPADEQTADIHGAYAGCCRA